MTNNKNIQCSTKCKHFWIHGITQVKDNSPKPSTLGLLVCKELISLCSNSLSVTSSFKSRHNFLPGNVNEQISENVWQQILILLLSESPCSVFNKLKALLFFLNSSKTLISFLSHVFWSCLVITGVSFLGLIAQLNSDWLRSPLISI